MKAGDEIFDLWHDAVENAIKGAPRRCLCAQRGNSDSDASFLRDVPAGLRLPNLIAVGAVNQAGDETSFTSYGPTVVVMPMDTRWTALSRRYASEVIWNLNGFANVANLAASCSH
jgi:hypothetical protein